MLKCLGAFLIVAIAALPQLAFALKRDQLAQQVSEFSSVRAYLGTALHGMSLDEQKDVLEIFANVDLDARLPLKAKGSALYIENDKNPITIGSDGRSVEYQNLIFRFEEKKPLATQIKNIAKRLNQLSGSAKTAWWQLLLPSAIAKSTVKPKSVPNNEFETAIFVGTSLSLINQYQDIGKGFLDRESFDPEGHDPVVESVRMQLSRFKKIYDIVCVPNSSGYHVVLQFADGTQSEVDVVRTSKNIIEGAVWTSNAGPKELPSAQAYWDYCRSKGKKRTQMLETIQEAQGVR